MKTAFIGHRQIFVKDISDRLICAIQTEIKSGCTMFTMGTHGAVDNNFSFLILISIVFPFS